MTVVVGYIPNDQGEAALSAALEECRRRETGLVVVNSTRGDRLVDPRYVQQSRTGELHERLTASGVPHEVRHFTSEESAADDLLDVAEEAGAELIVIGLRHRTAVGKLLMGSTAQTVLLRAPCQVLAVKA